MGSPHARITVGPELFHRLVQVRDTEVEQRRGGLQSMGSIERVQQDHGPLFGVRPFEHLLVTVHGPALQSQILGVERDGPLEIRHRDLTAPQVVAALGPPRGRRRRGPSRDRHDRGDDGDKLHEYLASDCTQLGVFQTTFPR